MTLNAASAYSILGVMGHAIVSKAGCLTIAYEMEGPEPYSLDAISLDVRHRMLEQAFRHLPAGSYVHKQDVFLKAEWKPEGVYGTFLSEADARHFTGRGLLSHRCVLAFTFSGLQSLEKAYTTNPLSYREDLTSSDREKLSAFIDGVEGAVSVISNLPQTRCAEMDTVALQEYLVAYINGFPGYAGMVDLQFGQELYWGDARMGMFAVGDENYLPDELPVSTVDDSLPMANSQLSMALMEGLGVHLPYNHIYNQVYYFPGHDQLKGQLKERVVLFGQHRRFDKEIEFQHGKMEGLYQEVVTTQAMLCRAHFNVVVWDQDAGKLETARELVRERLRIKDIKFYQPTFEGAYNLFLGSVIGRETALHPSYLFITELRAALALWNHYSIFRGDAEGVYFNDRLYQAPLRKDVWDAGKRRMPARNAMVISGSGGGKSATMQQLLVQLVEQSYELIVVEFGNSFKAVSQLYPERSRHIDYDGTTPLGINPFRVKDPSKVGIEKIRTLANLVLKYWNVKDIRQDEQQTVSVIKSLQDYYRQVPGGHSFPDFYGFIRSDYEAIIQRQDIPREYFNRESFLHVCSQFLPGGIYENICAESQTFSSGFEGKNLVVFELTRIKKDPFLVSVIMTILFETIEAKILADRSIRGMIIFDEYAEAATLSDAITADEIHPTVAFCCQKLRKENGAVVTVIQTPAQLPRNQYTDGIIGNTHLLYVLPTTETVYDSIIETFHIKNPSQIALMKSISNNFSGQKPYSEIFMRFMDNYATVVRLEFSPEKFLAFQTDGETWQQLQLLYARTGSMETAIQTFLTEKNEKHLLTRHRADML